MKHTSWSRHTERPALLMLGGALVLSSLLAAPVSPASAAIMKCDPRSSWITTSGSSTYTLTHVTGYQTPPGGALTLTKTAQFERKLSASVSGTSSVGVSASGVIASASANLSVTLAASGSVTSTKSQSVTFALSSSKKDRYYAAYAGRKAWSGSWQRKLCSSNGQTVTTTASGSWKSYQTNLEGVALCPATRYSSSSLQYKACKVTWG